MGSVSSLVSGHSLHSKHCQATEYKLKKAGHHRKTGRSLDGLLKYSFAQGSSNNTSKAISQAGRSEDFFYIKVSHKPRTTHQRGILTENLLEQGHFTDTEPDCRVPTKLLPMSGKLEKNTENALIRPTAFKPVIPRSTSSTETRDNLTHLLIPPERTKDSQGPKQDTFSVTLSDSGQDSMSSLPTQSTNGSLSASTGPLSQCAGGSAHGMAHPLQPPRSTWTNGNGIRASARAAALSNGGAVKANKDAVSIPSPQQPIPLLEEMGGCNRSPISMDESLIELLEQRLLESETELQELQVSFEEKEVDTCQLFEERQRYCVEEMEGLKQRCSTKLRQVSHRAVRNHQALQLQVSQLQQDKQRLQDELARMTQEKDLTEVKLRSFEREKTQLEPTLEETQWEVCQKTGEISLLKQHLRDSQADVTHKLNDIVSLKVSLKETRAKMEALGQQNKEQEDKIHSRSVEVEVCHNELQRKKNEADLLREKVGILETDIKGIKKDLALAKEQRQQQKAKLEAQAQQRTDQSGGREGCMSTDSLQGEVERLKGELREERETQERLLNSFEHERQTWNKEKDRVIKYQNQLQLNYLQMHKKNQDLERILQELTVELESRPELDVDIHSSGLHYEDMIATEI
ncbi:leucine zipper putative tumor suppressor 1-like [Oncorhynchus nerka]|uniref:leucine zipper putative tumor suppressor 1-like n=1 Tax=Oncorhynchus nerka TaxID=8023 RepID=UPI0011310AAD|nr:leucine zipper putative tumor suppressor 1-like [Oncorhynchus nerka]XP_029533495.1 leucine zipper putative tumor suppressor 1-like [Oncorhynchus nerka]